MWHFIIKLVSANDSHDVKCISVDVPVSGSQAYFKAWDIVTDRAKDELSKLAYDYYIQSITNEIY